MRIVEKHANILTSLNPSHSNSAHGLRERNKNFKQSISFMFEHDKKPYIFTSYWPLSENICYLTSILSVAAVLHCEAASNHYERIAKEFMLNKTVHQRGLMLNK